MRRQLFGGLLAAALVAFPLACGDDDDGGLRAGGDTTEADADDAESSDETDAPAVDETEPEDTDETEPPDTEQTEPPDTEADDSEDVSGGDLEQWCEQEQAFDEDDAYNDVFEGDADPAEVEAAFDDVESRIDEYIEVTPDEIRDEVDMIAAAFRQFRDVLEANDWDLQTVSTDPELAELFEDPELEDAQTRIDDFQLEHCP